MHTEHEDQTGDTAASKSANDVHDRKFWPTYRYIIILSASFTILSVYYALTYFPELSTIRAVIAGVCFGVFCSMCAATYSHFL